MQRIDENTYIDDTLVTCAEYQLFIDEMREQREYYVPDHWSSYRFHVGMAREPILGVRFNDAVTFCEWLTKRDQSNWNYRVCTMSETNDYPIHISPQSRMGYWITANENIEPNFKWINPIQMARYHQDIDHALANVDLNHQPVFDLNRYRPINIYNDIIKSVGLNQMHRNVEEYVGRRAVDITRVRENERRFALLLSDDIAKEINSLIDFISIRNTSINRPRYLIYDLLSILESSTSNKYKRMQQLAEDIRSLLVSKENGYSLLSIKNNAIFDSANALIAIFERDMRFDPFDNTRAHLRMNIYKCIRQLATSLEQGYFTVMNRAISIVATAVIQFETLSISDKFLFAVDDRAIALFRLTKISLQLEV